MGEGWMKKALEPYSKQAADFKAKPFSNQMQSETLTQLRDALLPQLISGKVRVAGFAEG